MDDIATGNLIDDMADELASLRAECASLRAEAARYQWLRPFWIHAREADPDGKIVLSATDSALDMLIDKAIAAMNAPEPKDE